MVASRGEADLQFFTEFDRILRGPRKFELRDRVRRDEASA